MHHPSNTLTLAHSPDPDDAYMWWPLGTRSIQGAPVSVPQLDPAISTGPYTFIPVAEDIQALNQRAMTLRDHHITAMSVFALGNVLDTYAMTTCGASFGLNYGPKVLVTAEYAKRNSLLSASPEASVKHLQKLVKDGKRIAIPGTETSAYLVLRLVLERILPPSKTDRADTRFPSMRFDRVIPALIEGQVDAALVIHEAQVTYKEQQLHLLVDLGAWWSSFTGGLPLPLGANAIRRDLDDPVAVTKLLSESIRYAHAHKAHSLEYAMHFARANAATPPSLDQISDFVDLYVNELTTELSESAIKSIALMMHHGRRLKMLPDSGDLEVISPNERVQVEIDSLQSV